MSRGGGSRCIVEGVIAGPEVVRGGKGAHGRAQERDVGCVNERSERVRALIFHPPLTAAVRTMIYATAGEIELKNLAKHAAAAIFF